MLIVIKTATVLIIKPCINSNILQRFNKFCHITMQEGSGSCKRESAAPIGTPSTSSSYDVNTRSFNRVPQNFRTWESIKTPDHNTFNFTVVSYNILAQKLLEYHSELYTNCSVENLEWNTRSGKLFDEIRKLDPDILCLQEVQESHVSGYFSQFNRLGYRGVFKWKTGYKPDGCAIYYKESVFTLLDKVDVEFLHPHCPVLNRDNIGIIVKLLPHKLPQSPIVVANTHLLFNPKRTDVRLAQMRLFLAAIDKFAFTEVNKEASHLPIILTGDFNSTPESAVIKLLDFGQVNTDFVDCISDWQTIGITDNCQYLTQYLSRNRKTLANTTVIDLTPEHNITTSDDSVNSEYSYLFNTNVVGQSLDLKSVYDKINECGDYEATTFQDFWVTVDYIYYSKHKSLSLVSRLRLPTIEECNVLGSLPNDEYGSDHLCLGAIFEMTPLRCSL